MVASCLLRLSKLCSLLIINVLVYRLPTLRLNFKIDGSINYWSTIQENVQGDAIDHYHSGFEIRALLSIWSTTQDPKYLNACLSYYSFYRSHLLSCDTHGVFPKLTPNSLYPIDIHSCAESIILASIIHKDFPNRFNDINSLIPRILKLMQLPDGSRYMIHDFHFFKYPIDISYMRWGNSWMFFCPHKSPTSSNHLIDLHYEQNVFYSADHKQQFPPEIRVRKPYPLRYSRQFFAHP